MTGIIYQLVTATIFLFISTVTADIDIECVLCECVSLFCQTSESLTCVRSVKP